MNTRLSRVFSHLQCSNISPKRSIVIASQLSNRLKHSDVRKNVDLGTEERKKTGIIYSYTCSGLVSPPFNN